MTLSMAEGPAVLNVYVKENQGQFKMVHSYETRNNNMSDVPRVRLARSRAEYRSVTICLLNHLLALLKSLDLKTFK